MKKKNRQQRSETQLRHSAETKYHDSATSEFCLNFHWFALLRTQSRKTESKCTQLSVSTFQLNLSRDFRATTAALVPHLYHRNRSQQLCNSSSAVKTVM